MTSSTTTGTTARRRRHAATTGWRRAVVTAVALLLPALALPLATTTAAAAAVPAATAAAALPGPVTYLSGSYPDAPPCPTGRYVVPAGVQFVQVAATAGGGAAGHSLTGTAFGLDYTVHDGGLAGTGAAVTATIPVTPGQTLTVVTGRDGSNDHANAYSGWPNGGENSFQEGGGGGSSYVTTQPLVASTGCKDINSFRLDRSQVLVMAGGGGGGGSASVLGAGGYAGSAGVNGSLNGENGRDAYHLDSDCGQGRGGAGASTTGPGAGGSTTCLSTTTGSSGQGFNGGEYLSTTINANAGPGAGGGGWYGGGGGSSGNGLAGGGGGAGSSYVTPTAVGYTVTQAKTRPAVIVTPVATPVSTLSINGGAPVDRYTGTATVTVTADAADGSPVSQVDASLDDLTCTSHRTCQKYTGPIQVTSTGLHTVSFFAESTAGAVEPLRTVTFFVAPQGSPAVTGPTTSTGTDPSTSTGGASGAPGSISIAGTGLGAVGAAVYSSNPGVPVTFDSTGAFAEISASVGVNTLASATVVDCDLRGGTLLYYQFRDVWRLLFNQTYDPTTQCVTVVLPNASRPGSGGLTPAYFAAGRPPTAAFTSTPPTLPALGASYSPTATASSGLPVTFTVTGPCTLTDGTVTFTGAGDCTITATQAGDAVTPAAVISTQTITIPKAAQVISFTSTAPTAAVVGDTYTPTATGGGSDEPVTFGATGPCTLTDGLVTFTGAGPCTITATQAGDADHLAAQATQTVTAGSATSRVTYPLSGTATVTGRAPVPFGSIPLAATLSSTGTTTAGTGFSDGQLGSTPTAFSGRVFGFLPATVTAHLESTAAVTATTTDTATTLTASVRLVVDQVSVFGLNLITPGATCATEGATAVTLTGAQGVLTTGGTLTGAYTAGRFTGCGLLAPFLQPQLDQLAGVPQAVTLTLGQPSTTG